MTDRIPQPTDAARKKIKWNATERDRAPRSAYVQHCRTLGFRDFEIAAALSIRTGSLSEFMRKHGMGRIEFNNARKACLK